MQLTMYKTIVPLWWMVLLLSSFQSSSDVLGSPGGLEENVDQG